VVWGSGAETEVLAGSDEKEEDDCDGSKKGKGNDYVIGVGLLQDRNPRGKLHQCWMPWTSPQCEKKTERATGMADSMIEFKGGVEDGMPEGGEMREDATHRAHDGGWWA
jgi:hypothetical protein